MNTTDITPDDINALDLYEILRHDIQADLPHYTSSPKLAGIGRGGAIIAKRLATDLGLIFGQVNIMLHRDDFASTGISDKSFNNTDLPFQVNGSHIILVDDVLYTGRTVRAAMNEIYDFGRPASITLAVLVDRQALELPIFAKYVASLIHVPQGLRLRLLDDPHHQTLTLTYGSYHS